MKLNQLITHMKAMRLKELAQFAAKADVPYQTALKIRNGTTKNPRVQTTEALTKAVRK